MSIDRIVVAMIVTMAVACGGGAKETETAAARKKTTGILPCAVPRGGDAAYIDEAGEFVPGCTFEKAAPFSEGLASVYVDGKRGYIDRSCELVIDPVWDDAGSFEEGRAAVLSDGLWGFIDEEGTTVVEPAFDDVWSFSEGLCPVKVDGSWGFIDEDGKMVIEPRFQDAMPFAEGRAWVALHEEEFESGHGINARAYIDTTGQIVIGPSIDVSCCDFSEGLLGMKELGHEDVALLDKEDEWLLEGFVDIDGTFVLPPAYEVTGAFSEGLAAVQLEGSWGFIDREGNLVIKPRFMDARKFVQGLAEVESGESLWGLVDTQGTHVVEPQFMDLAECADGYRMGFSVKEPDEAVLHLISPDGTRIWGPFPIEDSGS